MFHISCIFVKVELGNGKKFQTRCIRTGKSGKSKLSHDENLENGYPQKIKMLVKVLKI